MSRKGDRYEFCSNGEVREYLRYLEDRFGIPAKLFKGYTFLKKGKNIWIFSGDPSTIRDIGRIETIGVKFLTITKKALKPTTTFLQIFGKYATKNIVNLESEEEMIQFMMGGLIKKKFNVEKGYVIVKYKDDVLGCGLYSDVGLVSQIPKARRVDERWFERTEE